MAHVDADVRQLKCRPTRWITALQRCGHCELMCMFVDVKQESEVCGEHCAFGLLHSATVAPRPRSTLRAS
jgi:hypothetical protein